MTVSDEPGDRNRERRSWRLPEGVRLQWKSWGDEVVVFNAASGQTHLLDGLSGAILAEIEKQPATAAGLARRIAEAFEAADDIALEWRVEEICGEFDGLGLADPDGP